MQRLKPDVDIVLDILKAVLEAQPLSSFTQSLLFQYQERGGLSKKQLEGLYSKATKVKTIPPDKRGETLNRNQTDGKYAIWGHDLSDLYLMEIEVYKTKEGKIILRLNIES